MKKFIVICFMLLIGSGCSSFHDRGSTKVDSGEQFKKNFMLYRMVRVEKGTFTMGKDNGLPDEFPAHQVALPCDFFMGKYEVTQKEYMDVMGTNPSHFKGDRLPVEMVSWRDAIIFCNRLSAKCGLRPAYDETTGTLLADNGAIAQSVCEVEGFRLPTEAEWEFAAKGGILSKGFIYSGSNDAGLVGWCGVSSTHETGLKKPNELGIFDMTGNVWEWCTDQYMRYPEVSVEDSYYYVVDDALIPNNRGGGWLDDKRGVTFRGAATPDGSTYGTSESKFNCVGFRVCRTAK